MIEYETVLEEFIEWFNLYYSYRDSDLAKVILRFKHNNELDYINKFIKELEEIIKQSEVDGAWGYHMQRVCGYSRHEKTESFIRILYEELLKPFVRKDLWIVFLESYFDPYHKTSLLEEVSIFVRRNSHNNKMKIISILQTIVNTESYEHTAAMLKELTGISIAADEMKELVIESLRLFRA